MPPKTPSHACASERVRELCQNLGFSLDEESSGMLAVYLALLSKWNKAMNLVGPSRWEDMLATLVIDSLHLANFVRSLPLPEAPLCRDLGAGAGLPGLPLRILWRQGSYTLVEAREKRALFLRSCLAALPLPGVQVYHGRAEGFMAASPQADLTVSRAFLPWERVLEMIAPFSGSMSFCLFLTLAPLPERLPAGWGAAAEQRYTVGKDSRYFWALQKH